MTVNLAKVGDTWYRLDDVLYAPMLDEFETPIGPGRLDIIVRKHSVVRITPKGLWIVQQGIYSGGPRFILFNATKRHAHPTMALALESFVARKNRQASIHEARARQAHMAVRLATSSHGVQPSTFTYPLPIGELS
jgi:hypothetical protein